MPTIDSNLSDPRLDPPAPAESFRCDECHGQGVVAAPLDCDCCATDCGGIERLFVGGIAQWIHVPCERCRLAHGCNNCAATGEVCL